MGGIGVRGNSGIGRGWRRFFKFFGGEGGGSTYLI